MPVDDRFLWLMLIIGAMLALLALVLRWVFTRGRRAGPALSPAADVPATATADDYGLLAAAAVVSTEQDAKRLRDVLGLAGIKATTTQDRAGRWRVLVFSNELHRARRVAGGSSGSSGSSSTSSS